MTDVYAVAPLIDDLKIDQNIVKKINEYFMQEKVQAEAQLFSFVDYNDPLKVALNYYQQPMKFIEEEGLLGFSIRGRYGYTSDKKMLLVDVASILGPNTVSSIAKSPLISSSKPMGRVLKKIVKPETERIVFVNVQSIATDLGIGMFEELGMIFYSQKGHPFQISGGKIGQIASFSYEAFDKKWLDYEYLILSDKRDQAVLTGKKGISYQNQSLTGASPEIAKFLAGETEKAVHNIMNLLGKEKLAESDLSVGNGFSFACNLFLRKVKVFEQLSAIMELTDFEQRIKSADYFLIPEGYTTFRKVLSDRNIPALVIKEGLNTKVASRETMVSFPKLDKKNMDEIFEVLKSTIQVLYFRK
ncbi:glycerate kinase [Enterococcus sp. 2201sp1_2201st1_B8_2201SCRN_220225]|uniref:glycerate kinase n=1 Tax=unclassified Enterococcus TaxID=2608891 RepID=UPI0034A0F3A5